MRPLRERWTPPGEWVAQAACAGYDLTATARAQALRTAARHAHYLATYAERFNTLPRHTPEFRTRAREAVK